MQNTISSLFAAAVLAGALSAPGHADRVDDLIRNVMHKTHVPGLSMAIVQNGKVIRAQGYGFANLELKAPATPETVYSLHSVSKQFCATGIMLLVRDGKVGLDDPVTEYFPGTSPAWDGITVRHLLHHTSGIPDYLNDNLNLNLEPNAPDSAIPPAVARFPLKFKPGEKYAYSNTGYVMLALIIHQVSGAPDPVLLADRVFKPLGMTATRNANSMAVIPHRAARYVWNAGVFVNGAPPGDSAEISDGGVLSTVLDLAKWDISLDTDKVLTAAERRQMWTPGTVTDPSGCKYGFGFFVDTYRGRPRIWHYGSSGVGQRAVIAQFPKDRLSVILLVNGGEPVLTRLANQVADHYLKG
ncbi:MAG TPA: serine hydrolase domain-containing protein [Armatimonadota bacterium]|jgi:CubicO group peptidase (beta-lactamase class C family)